MKSPQYENYYDNKSHIFEELKMEVPDTEVPHSDCNVDNEIVSENKKLSKLNDQNKIKHEATENGLLLNVTIKTEHIAEEEILDNNKNMSEPYKLTVQDVQLNSDERLLKDNVNLLKPNNEQSNMARVAKLNELDNDRLTQNIHAKLCQKKAEIIACKCDSYNGVYKREKNLRNHVKRMHTNKEHKCICCGAVFKKKRYLTNHINKVHYDYGMKFACWCGKQFRSPEYLRIHKRRVHERTDNGRFQCDSCHKRFKMKYNLLKHIMSVHSGRTFDCWCGKQFRSPEYLCKHKRRLHERIDNGRFQCDSCQKTFKAKYILLKHIKSVHYDYGMTFDCWCGKQFRSPVYLRQHKRRQHEGTDNGRFQCESCQKFFKKKLSLFIHVKRFHYESESTSDC